jgi:beta-N-acetylhexosaminidase
MTLEQSLKLPPFNLSDSDIAWVIKTRDGLSTEDKIRQLFVHISIGDDGDNITRLGNMKPGGLHRFMGPELEPAWKATRQFLEMSEVPPFITGDIEGGGHGSPAMLQFPNQIALAAANDTQLSARLLDAVCQESKALGFNWSFTPVIDVNHVTQSAIVGTRSYGSDLARIAAQSQTHVEVLQRNGIAATAKHWPGEGYDQRDQHLVTTINPLSMEEWHKIFGKLYKDLIDQGLLTVMSAHIALPAYAALKGVAESLERYRPASVSKILNMDLLRGELGFNGLIVSDATPMAGLSGFASREQNVPQVIENGCDMFLFCFDEEQEYQFMLKGLREKRLSEQRLEDAVTRILGLKAALGLHKKSVDERIAPLAEVREIVKSKQHVALAKEAAGKSITLVKDVNHLLPLSPSKHKRVIMVDRGAPGMFPGMPRKPMAAFSAELEKNGFELSKFDPQNPPTSENCDLLIYVFAVESSLGLSHIHVDWLTEHQGLDTGMARYWNDVPTLVISFGHTYYLRDMPRAPAYVNAYSTTVAAQVATVERLMGEKPFEGSSPVDAFAGAPDAKF